MTRRFFTRRRYSAGKKAFFFSERSGMPFKYKNRVMEPGTGLIVDKSENDGKWNRVWMSEKPIITPEPQQLEDARPGFDFRTDAEESFFS